METKKQCRKCDKLLDLTKFSKHSGTKDKLDNRCKDCVKKAKKKAKESKDIKEYPVYELDIHNKDWQVGKPTGSILEREDTKYETKSKRYEVRIPLGNGKMKSKSFAFDKYDTLEKAKEEAEKWMINYSKENGLTKNMIRIIDDETIEVQLTKDMIMKTDFKFSDLCQKHTLCSTRSGDINSSYYSSLSINNKLYYFHKHITKYKMTDHINRDPMDNRLCNLRETTPKLNNNNRGPPKRCLKDPSHMLGIRFVKKDESWQARIKQNNKEYTKTFSVRKYGYDEAKKLAIEARKEFNELFNCNNT